MAIPQATGRQIRDMLNALPDAELDKKFKVWLPGSTISLANSLMVGVKDGLLMVEGNLDEGSALS